MTSKPSRLIWQGKSWRLQVHTFRLPDGSELERAAVEHPGSVALVPLQKIGNEYEVLMLKQYRFALDETILELPAGTREWNEDWRLCAQRELREETGYRAEKFESLGKVWPAPGNSDEFMAIYIATELSPDPLPADVDEEIEVVAMPLQDLVSMAKDGRLQDAKSIVAILRTADYLDQNTP